MKKKFQNKYRAFEMGNYQSTPETKIAKTLEQKCEEFVMKWSRNQYEALDIQLGPAFRELCLCNDSDESFDFDTRVLDTSTLHHIGFEYRVKNLIQLVTEIRKHFDTGRFTFAEAVTLANVSIKVAEYPLETDIDLRNICIWTSGDPGIEATDDIEPEPVPLEANLIDTAEKKVRLVLSTAISNHFGNVFDCCRQTTFESLLKKLE